ncbi:MAG TPA: radical SAM protein [Chloroflexota bacterium]|jgi:MoaA/NifB/PqqE/SkfB family radical SAM enzyme|nr:radical SAM protein [Chloroflexota bacterium]
MSGMTDHTELILDGTKINWYLDRVRAWERGERIAPITIDMALTRACNYACHFCYAMLQENDRQVITTDVMYRFLEDCAEIGVKGISLVSDGESTISPAFVNAVVRGGELGLSMACGTNGFIFNRRKLEEVLPHLTYLRINISAGERQRYAEIMGVKEEWYDRVVQNIRDMVDIKRANGLKVTIGLQMVLMPEYQDQVLPLARLGKELRPDYLVIKHCSDNEDGDLGVNYGGYKALYDTLLEAESLSDEDYLVKVKWSKIEAEGKRSYQRCYGAPFMLQISGSGLVAPCGMLFNERYKKFHIGNIVEQRFKDMWASDRYWEVMNYLASPDFNAQRMCGSLCLQHKVNEYLDGYKKGLVQLGEPVGSPPQHLAFV